MKAVKALTLIVAMALALNLSVTVPSFAQQDEAPRVYRKMTELTQAGKYAEAIPLAQRLLAIEEKARNQENVATALIYLARLYQNLSRYSEAEPLYKRSLAIREKALGPNHPDVANSLNFLAYLYVELGRYVDAEPLSKRSVAIYEKARGPNHPDVADPLNVLAKLYMRQGRYSEAEPLIGRALAIYEKARGPNHTDFADALNSLAHLYTDQDRYAEAEPLYKRSLAIYEKALGPNHTDFAALLDNLAQLYQAQDRYAEAEPLTKRSLAIREKALGPNHPAVAAPLASLAQLYQARDRYAEAEPLYKRSLAIYEKALGADHPHFATLLRSLAYLYGRQDRYAEAEPLYKRSLAIYEKALGPNRPAVAASLNDLAQLYQGQRRYSEALPLVQRTIVNQGARLDVALPVLLGAEAKGVISGTRAMDDALNVVQRAGRTSAAAAINKLAARLAAGSDRLARLVRSDQDLAVEGERLDKALIAAVSQEPGKRDSAAERQMRDRLAVITKESEALQKVFSAEFPDYAALSNPLPLAVKDIQGLLAADEALVAFATTEEEGYVLTITGDGFAWKEVPIGGAALAEKVAAFRRGLDVAALTKSAQGGKPELFDLGLAYDLYAALFKSVDDLVKGKGHLLVVPTGALTSLPFHLLVTEAPATAMPALTDIASYRNAAWLAKRQAVSVLPAIASLKALRVSAPTAAAGKVMVGFGDPVFDPAERASALAAAGKQASAGGRPRATRAYSEVWQGASLDRAALARALPSLLDTADELKAVAAKLGAPASDLHLAGDASETTVKRTPLSDYRVVYFATHGLVAGDVKGLAEPSLALTLPSAPNDTDDGLLTASEVALLKLNADWVVLSACNTAAGDKPGAEALSGLARAFFYAGARALLVSHWSVDSEAATRLTTSTFEIMTSDPKAGRAEAVRRAMLAYMEDTSSPLNAYPAFWGPFSVIGEGAAR